MFGKVIHMRLMMKIKMNSIEDSMKTLALLFSLIPFTLHANLDGVYKNTYQKNGYFCEFNADIKQAANSITLMKWITDCNSDAGAYSINMNGPVKFTLLKNKKVEVEMEEDVSVYDATTAELNENKFKLNYNFEAYLEGEVLKYEILFDFSLFKNVLNYNIQYKQNDQVIFNDEASGNKIN